METPTAFDLNQAVAVWRQSLASRTGPATADITELEAHLREEYAVLAKTGLRPDEAFLIASRRLGPARDLAEEFVKAEPGRVWRERFFWFAAFMLLLSLWQIPAVHLANYFEFLAGNGESGSPHWLDGLGFFGSILEPLIMEGVVLLGPILLLAWYLTRKSKNRSRPLPSFLQSRWRLVLVGVPAIMVSQLGAAWIQTYLSNPSVFWARWVTMDMADFAEFLFLNSSYSLILLAFMACMMPQQQKTPATA